jgi:isocitrate dehydrogenase
MYWAEALAAQSDDDALQGQFSPFAKELADNETKIVEELNAAQGNAVDIGGYYRPDVALTTAAMRPSATFNALLDSIGEN